METTTDAEKKMIKLLAHIHKPLIASVIININIDTTAEKRTENCIVNQKGIPLPYEWPTFWDKDQFEFFLDVLPTPKHFKLYRQKVSQDGSCLYHSLLYFYANPQIPAILYCYYLTNNAEIPHYDILSHDRTSPQRPEVDMSSVNAWRKKIINYVELNWTWLHMKNDVFSQSIFENQKKKNEWVKQQKKTTTFGDDTAIFAFVCMTGINLTVYKFNNNDAGNINNAENGCYQYFVHSSDDVTLEEKIMEEEAFKFGLSVEQYQKVRSDAEQLQLPFEDYLQMIQ